MQTAKFVVLGALETMGLGSGYDILMELERRRVDRWADVKAGSVYFAIKRLVQEGALREARRERSGGYPAKTLYEVTEAGRALFDELQAEAMGSLYPDFLGFKLALKFNVRLEPEAVAARAAEAISRLDAVEREMAAHLESPDLDERARADDAFFIRHDQLLIDAERRWLREAAARSGPGAGATST